MKKICFIIVVGGLIMAPFYGQKLSHAIVSSGAIINKNISVIVGQLATSTLKSMNVMTQGFLQPYSSPTVSVPINNEISVEIYPNPVSEFLNIKSPKPVNYYIYDINGVCVASGNTSTDSIVDMHNKKIGIYIIRIENSSFKIIKQ